MVEVDAIIARDPMALELAPRLHYQSTMKKQKRRLGLSRETVKELGNRTAGVQAGQMQTGISCVKCSLSGPTYPNCAVITCSCHFTCYEQ